jgi:hypothetical protein
MDSRWKRFGELNEGDIGGRKMIEEPLYVELRVAFDAGDTLENWRLVRFAADELVIGAGLHAMRRRQ